MSTFYCNQLRITGLVGLLLTGFFILFPNPAPATTPTYGPANESCTTAGIVLTPQDNWKTRIQSASPGTTFLLRAGTYRTDTLTTPAGTSAKRITVKPYNCESVTIDAQIEPSSFTTFAGLTLGGSIPMVIRVISSSLIEGVTIRNSNIISSGSAKDPIRLWGSGGLKDLLIEGNTIVNGNVAGSNASTFDIQTKGINNVIRNNHITTPEFGLYGNDGFEIAPWSGTWTIEGNRFDGGMGENFFDVKYAADTTGNVIYFRNNYLDGSRLQSGCTLFHGRTNGTWPFFYTVYIERNTFVDCTKGNGALNWRSFKPKTNGNLGDGALDIGELIIRENIFRSDTNASGITVSRSNITIENNTMYFGELNVKSGYNLPDPKNVVVKNNIFYKTAFFGSGMIDTCRNNDFFQASSAPGNCPGSITADPQFVDPANANFTLKSTSPAIGAGEGGVDMGAIPFGKTLSPPKSLRVVTP